MAIPRMLTAVIESNWKPVGSSAWRDRRVYIVFSLAGQRPCGDSNATATVHEQSRVHLENIHDTKNSMDQISQLICHFNPDVQIFVVFEKERNTHSGQDTQRLTSR